MSDYTYYYYLSLPESIIKQGHILSVYSFPNYPPYSSPNANTQCSFHSLKLIQFALLYVSYQ